MKVRVNMERCVGHGMCMMACPEVFALNDDDGTAIILKPDVPPELEAAVDHAVRGCPEQAIVVENEVA